MNRKQLVILLIALVVLGGAGLVLYQRNAASYRTSGSGGGQKLLGDFDLNAVAHIVIRQTGGEVNLIKKDDLWRVRERRDYAANFNEVGELVRKIADMKVVQSEEVGPSQLPRLELVEPGKGGNAGTLVEFKDKSGKNLKSLLLGKKHVKKSENASPYGGGDWPDGRYVLALDSKSAVRIIADPLSNVEAKPENWLNKDFFKLEKPRLVSVTHTNATNSWKLTRETEASEWKLAETRPGEQLDGPKASGVSQVLSSPSFVDVPTNSSPAETGFDKPLVATLETFDNFTYTVKVGKKTPEDNYYFEVTVAANQPKERTPGKDEKPEDKDKLDKEFKEKQKQLEEKLKAEKAFEKWTYLVSKWTIDPLLKERKDFLAEKKEEPKKEEPIKDEPKKEEPKKESN